MGQPEGRKVHDGRSLDRRAGARGVRVTPALRRGGRAGDAVNQQALDMPDGLRAPFYTIVYRYGTQIREEWDELEEALCYLRGGEDMGEHSTSECGDADGWLWKRGKGLANFIAADRAPVRGRYFFYDDD